MRDSLLSCSSLEVRLCAPAALAPRRIIAGMDTIAIIGGGAAGLMAAVEAAVTLRREGVRGSIVVYEVDDERIGRSILATGNGRCNISNAHIRADVYRNSDFVLQALLALQSGYVAERGKAAVETMSANPVLERFADLGLCVREEPEGRLYPQANKASSVLDVLRAAVDTLGVRVEVGKRAVRVDAPSAGRSAGCFNIRFADRSVGHAASVILAVGGRAAAQVQLPAPLTCSDMRPVLGPLRVTKANAKLTRQLNNIRVRCAVSLSRAGEELARERGEVLFRDYGVSGVAVFNLSREAQPGDKLSIDLLPDISPQQMEHFLLTRRKRMQRLLGGALSVERFLDGLLLPAVANVLVRRAGLNPAAELSKADIPQLATMLKRFALTVEGIGDERQCQVRRGGYPVGAFDPNTCEAKDVPGLFVVGEALDVDAPCGGYNLHWAWSSGMLAGRAAAQSTR